MASIAARHRGCFHVACIDTWFQLHSSCPLCRAQVACHSHVQSESVVSVRNLIGTLDREDLYATTLSCCILFVGLTGILPHHDRSFVLLSRPGVSWRCWRKAAGLCCSLRSLSHITLSSVPPPTTRFRLALSDSSQGDTQLPVNTSP